jgi:molybdopterin converting factor small subunit
MSAIPEVSLQEDEPMRCGIGTGGYGDMYAISAGCAVRVGDRLHLNGALAYTPSIDYQYGSTSSVAGRIGFSFPLGKTSKPKAAETQSSEVSEYRVEVNNNIAKLQDDVESRNYQINELKTRLDELVNKQNQPVAIQGGENAEATNELITLLQARIEQLEEEKRNAEAANNMQDQKIQELETKLAEQESMFKKVMNQLKSMIPGQTPSRLGETSQIRNPGKL